MSDSLKNIKGFLNKKFVTAMETKILEDIDYLNLGIPSMNYVISGKPYSGGLPLSGKMSVIYGPEAAGKTSIILNAISQAQKQNIDVVEFLDFFDSYKTTILQNNQFQNDRRQAYEQLNWAVGKIVI